MGAVGDRTWGSGNDGSELFVGSVPGGSRIFPFWKAIAVCGLQDFVDAVFCAVYYPLRTKQPISVALPLTFSAQESLAKRLIPAQIFMPLNSNPLKINLNPVQSV